MIILHQDKYVIKLNVRKYLVMINSSSKLIRDDPHLHSLTVLTPTMFAKVSKQYITCKTCAHEIVAGYGVTAGTGLVVAVTSLSAHLGTRHA